MEGCICGRKHEKVMTTTVYCSDINGDLMISSLNLFTLSGYQEDCLLSIVLCRQSVVRGMSHERALFNFPFSQGKMENKVETWR